MKVRALPCASCEDGIAKLPGGAPYLMANAPLDIGARGFSYSCHAHPSHNPKHPNLPAVPTVRNHLTAYQWNQLLEFDVAEEGAPA